MGTFDQLLLTQEEVASLQAQVRLGWVAAHVGGACSQLEPGGSCNQLEPGMACF